MDPVRVGWVGCGGIAKTHARQMQEGDERLCITAAVDVERSRAEEMADLLPGARAAADYREIYDNVDAVLLALPHDLHCEVALDFLKAGKHVLVEKPMANTEAECRRMMAAARAADRKLMVAYCMRYHALVRKMRELIAKETYGETFQVSIWTEQLTHYPEGHWALSAERLGGGQFFSHGCHYVDILLWYLGRPVRGLHMGTNYGTPWMEKEGTSNVTLEFENGAMGYHFGTWGARGTRLRYAFHAHCTEGMLELQLKEGRLLFHHGETEEVIEEYDAGGESKPMLAQMRHFLDCIREDRAPFTDAASSLEGLRVIWKLYEAEEANMIADLRGEGLGTLAERDAEAAPA
jgi:predicted dehydrogenase